jgi:hypothetical protein
MVNTSTASQTTITHSSVLYVIILSAAMDLVPATTPKGLVAFFNIFPALIVRGLRRLNVSRADQTD